MSAQVISRGAGRNAVNAAAYRRGACMYDGRTGETFCYVQKRDVLYSEIAMPEGAPTWVQALLERHAQERVAASEELWNRVETHEKRPDAQLAREIEIALPAELSLEENIGLARLFVTEQLASRGFAADWSIHQGANGNIHAHIMLTIRPLTEQGFGAKREALRDAETGEVLRDKRGRILYAFGNPWGGKADLLALREQWADYANLHLARAGHDVRIDHRSHEVRSIDVTPTVHKGTGAKGLEERGTLADRAEAYEEARAGRPRDRGAARARAGADHPPAGGVHSQGHRARNRPLCGRRHGLPGHPDASHGFARGQAARAGARQSPCALLHTGDDPGRARYAG